MRAVCSTVPSFTLRTVPAEPGAGHDRVADPATVLEVEHGRRIAVSKAIAPRARRVPSVLVGPVGVRKPCTLEAQKSSAALA